MSSLSKAESDVQIAQLRARIAAARAAPQALNKAQARLQSLQQQQLVQQQSSVGNDNNVLGSEGSLRLIRKREASEMLAATINAELNMQRRDAGLAADLNALRMAENCSGVQACAPLQLVAEKQQSDGGELAADLRQQIEAAEGRLRTLEQNPGADEGSWAAAVTEATVEIEQLEAVLRDTLTSETTISDLAVRAVRNTGERFFGSSVGGMIAASSESISDAAARRDAIVSAKAYLMAIESISASLSAFGRGGTPPPLPEALDGPAVPKPKLTTNQRAEAAVDDLFGGSPVDAAPHGRTAAVQAVASAGTKGGPADPFSSLFA